MQQTFSSKTVVKTGYTEDVFTIFSTRNPIFPELWTSPPWTLHTRVNA